MVLKASTRLLALGALSSLAGCSFLDDFDKFGPRPPTDMGEQPASADGSSADAGEQLGEGGRPVGLDARAGEADPQREAGRTPEAGATEAGSMREGTRDGEVVGDGAAAREDDACVGSCSGRDSDGDPCTYDLCEGGACQDVPLDRDGDGFAPASTCGNGSTLKPGDCDDDNRDVRPGATELCDGLDNNCRDGSDEGFTRVSCYPDRDRDGYANLDATPVQRCVCRDDERMVAGVVDEPFRRAQHDCWDDVLPRANLVNPGQTEHQEEPYQRPGAQPSFDYDCREGEQAKWPTPLPAGGCQSLLLDLVGCMPQSGFLGVAPACGKESPYASCMGAVLGDLAGCQGPVDTRRQRCL